MEKQKNFAYLARGRGWPWTERYSASTDLPKAPAENLSADSQAFWAIRRRRSGSSQNADRQREKSPALAYSHPLTPSSTTPSTHSSRRHSTGIPAARASK